MRYLLNAYVPQYIAAAGIGIEYIGLAKPSANAPENAYHIVLLRRCVGMLKGRTRTACC